MELCKSYYGLLLISLIYIESEVRSKICKQSVESPYGSVRKIHPGALADKFPHKSDGKARYRDLYDLITETIYRNSKSTESASFHQDIKVYSEYKLPKNSRRHLNMVMKGDKEELIDLANLEREHFIPLGRKDESMHSSRNDKNIANHFKYAKFHYPREIFKGKSRKMQMSIENIPESSTVIKNNDRGTKFTMRIANENDSIQELNSINDTKKSPLFRILFTRYPNKYLLKRKRDDSYYFLRLQNSADENRKRQRITLDPFWPRATPFTKRRKTIQPDNPFKIQNVSTEMPTWIHFAPKEKIPKRKSKNKSHIKNSTQFKVFGSSVQKKIPILFADLSSKNVGKMSGTEYSENAEKVRITLEEQMEETLSNGITEGKTESSFSTNLSLSNENIPPENLEFTETDNSSPLHHTVGVKDAAGAKPELTEGVRRLPEEQATNKISTENSESTATDINSPTDHLNENEGRTETESESIKSSDNTQIDQFNSTQNTDIENTDTETGNSLSTEGLTSSPKVQATYKIPTENSESRASDLNYATDHLNENEDKTETKSESIKLKDNTTTDQFNNTQNTDADNTTTDQFNSTQNTDADNTTTDQFNSTQNTDADNTTTDQFNSTQNADTETGNSLSTEGLSISPKVQGTDKISAENSESTASNLNSATDHLNENKDKIEAKSKSIKSKDNTTTDQFNSTQNTDIENTDTEIGNSLSINHPAVFLDTFEANTESTKKNSNSLIELASDHTTAVSSESREVDNSSPIDQLSEKENIFETKSEPIVSKNSTSKDLSNSKETTSVENSEATEAGNILPKDKTTRAGNTSETYSKNIAADNTSSGALTVGNISVESLETIQANTTESAEIIYRGYESNSSLRDQLESKENTSPDDLESTKVGNSLLTNHTTRAENTSQTNTDLIKAESSINFRSSSGLTERMAANKTSTGNLEPIKVNVTIATDIVNGGGTDSLLTDQSNSKENPSAKKSESKEATKSLTTNHITRAVNTSETNSKEIEAENSSSGARTAANSFVESSESINVNITESSEKIYRHYEANSKVLTNQFNSIANISSNNLESIEVDKNLSTKQSTIVVNASKRNSKSITTESSFTRRMTADNTSTVNIEFIKLNTTVATERMYRDYEANSSLIYQSNDKGIASTENFESKDVGNSLHTNQSTEVRNMSEKKPESIDETNSFLEKLVTGNTSNENLEYNVTFSIEKIYRDYGINGSLTSQFDSKINTSTENPDSTEAYNNLQTSQTTGVGNTSQRNPESINAGSSFSEKLATDNTSAESLESVKTNIAETTEIIYRGYRANSSLIGQFNNKENTSTENSDTIVVGNSFSTNQIIQVGNISEMKLKSVSAEYSFPERLVTDKTSAESLESIKFDTTPATEKIYSGYVANSSLTRKTSSEEIISAENSESTEVANSLSTNQTTRVKNTTKKNAKLIEEDKNFPGRHAADNSTADGSESIKHNSTDSTDWIYKGYEDNSSKSRKEDNKSNIDEKTFIDSLEHIKVGNSIPEIGNTSPAAANSSPLENKSSVAADSKSAETDISLPLEYDLYKISPTKHYLQKISPLSSNRNESLDKENLKTLNPQA